MTHLEGFADEFVMVGQVGPAVDAGVGPVAGGEILAECLRHLLETNMNSSKHFIESWSHLLVLLVSSAWLRAVCWTCAAHVRLVCYCATWGREQISDLDER